MLAAKAVQFREILEGKTYGELVEIAVAEFCAGEDARLRLSEFEKSTTEMAVQFQQMKDELKGANDEIARLRKKVVHMSGVEAIQNQELFGRSTEKAEDVVDRALAGAREKDPTSEDAEEAVPEDGGSNGGGGRKSACKGKSGGDDPDGKKKKKKGKRKRDLSGLPVQTCYDYDIEEYDRLYGENNWRFGPWHKYMTVEKIRTTTYLKVTYTPTISVGEEHCMVSMPSGNRLLPKSIVTPSLGADILTDRFGMSVPFYRLAAFPDRYGFPLSRQTMTNWTIRFAEDLFSAPYRYMASALKRRRYQQCDETYWLVILDGRRPGSKSFIWTHRTSELSEGPVIIIYCYEKTRKADHLFRFYKDVAEPFFLTCDAYSAYPALAEALGGLVILCGCMMHVRRRFVDALNILDLKGLDPEKVMELPEMKAISLIGTLYYEEGKLADLSPDERTAERQNGVKEAAQGFFDFVEGFNIDDPLVTEKMKDAVQYARNHKEELLRFLEDGNIPIDDGATERSIRPVALSRHNSLFSNTVRGANASCICATMYETAVHNGADPYYYYKYLLEKMPDHLYDKDGPYLEDMMPWSDAYRAYEAREKQRVVDSYAPSGNARPQTPRKMDRLVQAG